MQPSGASACPAGAAAAGNRGALPGFRHFLGDPAAAERFQVDGADPRESAEALATLRRRLRGLAMLMGARPAAAAENPAIPSGYTYVLQLAAHDMVASTAAFWAPAASPPGVANAAGQPLQLRTLYGDGPAACPFAFAPDDAQDQSRSRFRLSAVNGEAPGPTAFRDIGRAATAGTLGGRPGRGEALVADGRNDQSALLAQVTALFQLLHNAVLDQVAQPGSLPAKALREATAARYAVAREATALVFRTVLRADVLPRLLHPAVQALHADTGAPGPTDADWLDDPGGEDGLALEFSHGAFRFGHAMLRDTYRIGDFPAAPLADLLRLNSARSPNAMPLTRRWIIRWSQFFQLPRQPAPNASMRLGPRYSAMLLADGLFDPIEAGDPAGIAYRDLLSASLAGLRSVASLAATVARRRPALAALAPMLADPALRQASLARWIGQDPGLSLLEPADVQALAADPPLPFYLLFEAEQDAAGSHLGILGSVLVAETIYGAMARSPLPAEAGGGGLAAALDRLCAARLGDARLPDPPVVQDMPGLVGYLARRLGLADAGFL